MSQFIPDGNVSVEENPALIYTYIYKSLCLRLPYTHDFFL